MAKTLLGKMFLKPEYSIAILHMPKDLQIDLTTQNKTDNTLKSEYNFILAFYTNKNLLEKEISQLKTALLPNGLFWVAYPKAKALDTDLNRDILHGIMAMHKLDGVSLVSLNQTWSAMRFKKK